MLFPNTDRSPWWPHSLLYYFVFVIANLFNVLALPAFRKSSAKLQLLFEPAKLFAKIFQNRWTISQRPVFTHRWSPASAVTASFPKAGAKVDTFCIPTKIFTNFFQSFFSQTSAQTQPNAITQAITQPKTHAVFLSKINECLNMPDKTIDKTQWLKNYQKAETFNKISIHTPTPALN